MAENPIIAIIDSGVDNDIPFKDKIIGGISFYIKEETLYCNEDIKDDNGHGTKCIHVINGISSNSLIYVVKIIDESSKRSSFLLLEALKYLLYINVDIINISLSVNGRLYIHQIDEVIESLNSQGKIIVVSVENGKETSYPANSKNTVGVMGRLMYENKIVCERQKEIQIIANSMPVLCLGLKGKYEWFGGNSKATTLVSAQISNFITQSGRYNLDRMMNILAKKSDSTLNFPIITSKFTLSENERKLMNVLLPVFSKYMCSYAVKLKDTIYEMAFDMGYTSELLDECEKKIDSVINRNKIKFCDFCNIESLVHSIYNNCISLKRKKNL